MNKDIMDILRKSVKSTDLEYMEDNKNKKQWKKEERYNKYLDYTANFIESNITQNVSGINKNDDLEKAKFNKEILEEMLDTFTENDKALIAYKALLKNDMKLDVGSGHSLDNRRVFDYWLSIQIGSVMEKLTIIDGQLKGYDLTENEKATHSNSDEKCYEPDLTLRINGNEVGIELQTVDKKHEHIICKKSKLRTLKWLAENENRHIYILQQTVVDNECSYALIDVKKDFTNLKFTIEKDTNKKWMRAVEKAEYKDIESIIKDIELDIEKEKKPLTLEDLVKSLGDRVTVTNKTIKARDLGVEH